MLLFRNVQNVDVMKRYLNEIWNERKKVMDRISADG